MFNVSELTNFVDLIQREVQETERLNLLEAAELHNLVLAQVESGKHGEVIQPGDAFEVVLPQIEL